MENLIKTVLVTGATSGIGKATATIFAKHGYNVIITGRREALLEELKTKLKKKYAVKIKSLCFDIRKKSDVKKAIKSLSESWSTIDILVNNAGLAMGLDPIQSGSLEHWDTMIDTNVKGLLYITRQVAPNMVKSNQGHIINVCSTAGTDVYPNGGVYCASKSAVDMLTRGMRLDMYKFGVRISQVSPGMVEETEFAITRFEGDKEKANIYNNFTPLTSKDVAETIYYIATRPKHINIQNILMMSTQQAGSNFVDRTGRK